MSAPTLLCPLVLVLAGACAVEPEKPVEQTQHNAPSSEGDAGDVGVGALDGAVDADVSDVLREWDATSRADAEETLEPRRAAWRRPAVVLATVDSTATRRLSELGLYRDIATKQLAPDLIEYEPRYSLWADGAYKRRWLVLPEGAGIDTSDPDHYRFPQGSVLFKEFASEDGRRLETRVLACTGPLPSDVFLGSFVWLDDESDAVLVPDGAIDVRGTQHDVPSQKNCDTCHRGEPGRVLGFSAVQSPRVIGSSFVVPGAPYEIPGDEAARAALGYLHANCAHCHNDDGIARKDTTLALRISVRDVVPQQTTIERSVISVLTDHFTELDGPAAPRLEPGHPETSVIVKRMKQRGESKAMPPLGTKRVDEAGVHAVERWIASLAGAPPPAVKQ